MLNFSRKDDNIIFTFMELFSLKFLAVTQVRGIKIRINTNPEFNKTKNSTPRRKDRFRDQEL